MESTLLKAEDFYFCQAFGLLLSGYAESNTLKYESCMNNWILVFIGGGLGSVARFGVASGVRRYFETNFPVATLLANVISCLIFGLTLAFFSQKLIEQPYWRLLIITGFCGGFSTFSAFSFETVELIRTNHWMIAGANVVISMSLCFAIFYTLVKSV